MFRHGAAFLALGLALLPARADISVRSADHPGFGRLVLQISGAWRYHSARSGDDVTLTLGNTGDLPANVHLPRNVRSLDRTADALHLALAPGAKLKITRIGNRLVLDAYDPAVVTAITPPPAPQPPAPQPPAPQPPAPAPTKPPPPPAAAAQPGSSAIAVTRADMPSNLTGNAILVPFETNVGAAAFARGGHEIIVFDEASPLDLAQIAQDSVFGGSSVTELEDSTILRLPHPANTSVRLMRVDAGWLVMFEDAPSVISGIEPAARGNQLFLPATDALKTIIIPDDVTGENLLVGTQKSSGQATLVEREAPEYRQFATDMGVVFEPVSDRLHLLAVKDGFTLGLGGPGPDITLPSAATPRMADAAHLSRHYEFPYLDTPSLFREMQSEIVTAALSPPLSRFEPRYQVAQTMVALGLDAEAEAVMQMAVTSDASQSDNPDAKGLQAIAATLAGRLDETDGLDDPRLDQWDDVKLWRATRDAMRNPGSPAAAAQLAATAPLILAYPDPLQRRLAPVAVETMALGGQLDAARALAAKLPDDPDLALGRAMIDEKRGNVDTALAEYDALDASTDRNARALAADRAVELRLATGKLSPGEAATALEHQFLNWRGDGRELALRERAAQLRGQAHDWRNDLALLREAQTSYPDQIPQIKAMMANELGNMLRADGAPGLPPLDLVSLADENADLIAASPQADELAGILADKLIALDLPQRAAPVLQKLLKNSASGLGQAKLGVKLAEVQLDQANPQGALDALAASSVDGLPDDLATERAMAAARADAALNKPDDAGQLLAAINDPKADDLRASIYENAKNWPSAEAALSDLATLQIPPTGDLTDPQRDILVRLASASAQAGDAARLKTLRGMADRMGTGDRADMFKLLIAEPVKQLSDLSRARNEDALAGSVPGAVGSLR